MMTERTQDAITIFVSGIGVGLLIGVAIILVEIHFGG